MRCGADVAVRYGTEWGGAVQGKRDWADRGAAVQRSAVWLGAGRFGAERG